MAIGQSLIFKCWWPLATISAIHALHSLLFAGRALVWRVNSLLFSSVPLACNALRLMGKQSRLRLKALCTLLEKTWKKGSSFMGTFVILRQKIHKGNVPFWMEILSRLQGNKYLPGLCMRYKVCMFGLESKALPTNGKTVQRGKLG